MRRDNGIASLVTGIFVIATLIVGAELLYAAGIAIDGGDQGMVGLGERHGIRLSRLFLISFRAAAMSSLIGVWNGFSLMLPVFRVTFSASPMTTPTVVLAGAVASSISCG